jgi:hypothetical protein
MERRATDPEALDDLFRLDHLTTRMRRHAEGLVILAGAPPGRGWSSPVRMVDVMRGAIAEVEDYARVSVATRSQAALAGSAVADVIHLLAELIENATTLSPPYTSVRVAGDTVASGFAIEVEDRGLGMSPPRLAELNDRLASPPEFNPSDSEQLGLFVVGQLARRHGIRVTLKASAYGGTAAVVLIPQHLVVTEEAFRAGLPGEPAAISLAPSAAATNGNHAAEELAGPAGLLALRGAPDLGPGAPELGPSAPDLGPGAPADIPGLRIPGPLRRSPGGAGSLGGPGVLGGPGDGQARGARHAAPRVPVNTGPEPEPDQLPRRHRDEMAASPGAGMAPGSGPDAANGADAGFGSGQPKGVGAPAGTGPATGTGSPAEADQPSFNVFMPRHRSGGSGEPAAPPAPAAPAPPADAGADQVAKTASYVASPTLPDTGSAPYQAPAAYPPGGTQPYQAQPTPFPGWTGRSVAGEPAGTPPPGAPPPGAPLPGGPPPGAVPGGAARHASAAGPATPTPMTPVASPRPAKPSGPPWELSRQTGPLPAVPGVPGVLGVPGGGDPDGPVTGDEANGLPRRVKQANLAPQLRANPPGRRTSPAAPLSGPQGPSGPAGGPSGPPGGPSPAEIRQTMSALQRGWQEGRAQRGTRPAPAGPPQAGPPPAGPPQAGPAGQADPAEGQPPPEDQPRGNSDGT